MGYQDVLRFSASSGVNSVTHVLILTMPDQNVEKGLYSINIVQSVGTVNTVPG